MGGRGDFHCLDCGVDTNEIDEYYMVKSAIWSQAERPFGPDGMLETRIGRTLQPSDFTEHMGQRQLDLHGRRVSPRLLKRLTGER